MCESKVSGLKVMFSVAMVLLMATASTGSAEVVKIRSSYVVPSASVAPMMTLKKDILKNWGKSYIMEFTRFRGTSAALTAFAAKELEFGTLAFSSFLLAVKNAKLDLKMYAENFKTIPSRFSNNWAALADSKIRTIADLRGKTIAINTFGAAVDLHLRAALMKAGINPEKDANIVEVRFPAQETMLREKKIDVACFVQPFWQRALVKGNLRAILNGADGMKETQFTMFVGRREFVEEHRAAVQDWFEDWLIFFRWALDPKNRDEMISMTAKYSKLPEKVFKGWYLTERDYWRDPKGEVDVPMLQKNWEELNELGLIKNNLRAADYADLSLIREAQRRLGIR